MGTRCDIYIEEDDENFVGAQCFFDGYPEHMLPQLDFCGYRMLKDYIIVAGSRGGFRLFYPSKGETEFAGGMPFYLYDPHSRNNDADYIYVMDQDGKVNWKARSDGYWNKV